MSLRTWKAEFYPVEASLVPVELALDHSIKKWEGLLLENLAKHEVELSGWCPTVSDRHGDELYISGSTCSLCHHYVTGTGCRGCPLSRVRGGVPCDKLRHDEKHTPYATLTTLRDPQPMLLWLRKAKQKLQNDAAKMGHTDWRTSP